MKYVPPFGVSDPNAPYINGDPSIARKGSIPPAAVFENPQREVVGVIQKSNFVPDETDLLQLTKSVRSQFINFADDTGSQDTLSCAFNPPIEAYTVGLPIRVRVKVSNSGACTIDAGAGRVTVRRPNGAALAIGDLTAGGLVDLVYDGTAFQMINFLGTGAGGGDIINNYNSIPYCVDTGTANNIIAPFSPAITSLSAGQPILVKIKRTNSGPTTINVNSLPLKSVKTGNNKRLLPEDLVANSVVLMIYDGTDFYVDPNISINSAYTINVPTTQFNTVNDVFNELSRKLIGNSGYVTIQIAAGVYTDPISVFHPSAGKITIKGTLLSVGPTPAHFAQNGSSAATRASDGAYNLNMLRGIYGTEIRINSTTEGIGVRVAFGTVPIVQDLLIVHGNPNINFTAIGDQSCTCVNVSTWGCRTGIYSDGTGIIAIVSCWACNSFYGFGAIHGGIMGFSGTSGAFGCEESGFIASAGGNMNTNYTYARCNGHYGYTCTDLSQMNGVNVDGLYNGVADLICARLSQMSFVNLTASWSSPVVNEWGNNNAIIYAY